VEVLEAHAECIPLASETIDAAVSTLVLCSVKDINATLGEIYRLLRPGGHLVLIEHVRAPGWLGWAQDVISLAASRFLGCTPNRRTAAALEHAGFVLDCERLYVSDVPSPLERYALIGTAVKKGQSVAAGA
jgi:ubiquinone/menaquinone biosynthesis C-methylase UbiE